MREIKFRGKRIDNGRGPQEGELNAETDNPD